MDKQRIMRTRLEGFTLLALTAVLFFANTVAAQDKPVVDLVLEIVKDPIGVTTSGTDGTLTFTVTNLGPDPAGTIPPGTFGPIVVGTESIFYSTEYGSPIHFQSTGYPD